MLGGAIPGGMTPIPGPAVIMRGMSAGESRDERGGREGDRDKGGREGETEMREGERGRQRWREAEYIVHVVYSTDSTAIYQHIEQLYNVGCHTHHGCWLLSLLLFCSLSIGLLQLVHLDGYIVMVNVVSQPLVDTHTHARTHAHTHTRTHIPL